MQVHSEECNFQHRQHTQFLTRENATMFTIAPYVIEHTHMYVFIFTGYHKDVSVLNQSVSVTLYPI